MLAQTGKGRLKGLTKSPRILVWLILLGTLAGSLSCGGSGTNSTNSSSSGAGTGTGWVITIQLGSNPVPFGSNSTSIVATVRDRNGAPAPFGTNICTTVVLNSLLSPSTTVDPTKLLKSFCETTKNDLGQSIQTYAAVATRGDDTVEVSSQGVIARATLTVN